MPKIYRDEEKADATMEIAPLHVHSGIESPILNTLALRQEQDLISISRTIEIITADVTLPTDTTETDLISVSIPGGTLGVNGGVKATLYIGTINDAISNTITIRVKYGGTTLITRVSTFDDSNENQGYINLFLLAQGAENLQEASIYYDFRATLTAIIINSNVGNSSEDSKQDLDLVVSAQWTTSDAGNVMVMSHAIIETIK